MIVSEAVTLRLSMPKTKWITPVISSLMLFSALATLGSQVAEAKRPIFLLEAPCANAGFGNWREDEADVSIGRAVYRSQFYMGAGDRSAALTCKIRPDDYAPLFQTLRLGFGMRDNDRRSPPNVVTVYLDGKAVVSRTIKAGQSEVLPLDVSNVSNISIETSCSNKASRYLYCDRVYFFDATLERIPPPLEAAPLQ